MIIIGYSGQISIGQSFFFGLGAYTTAYLGVDHGWNFLLTLPVSAALGFAVGFLVGIPALRIRGLYLALVTLALAAVFPVIAKFQALEQHHRRRERQAGRRRSSGRRRAGRPATCRTRRWQFLVLSAIGRGHVPARLEHDEEPARAIVWSRSATARSGAAVSGVWPAGWKVGAFADQRRVWRDRRLDARLRRADRRTRDRWLHRRRSPCSPVP